jgi:hypothetical protein
MPAEPCAAVEARLVEALLARREPDPADRDHARGCVVCAAARDELEALRLTLGALPAPEPSRELASGAWRRAARELRTAPPARSTPGPLRRGVAEGFPRELARLLAVALAPLPLVALWNAAFLALGDRLLAGFVPAPLLSILAAAYVLSAAAWLSLLYGSLPFVAQRRAERRGEEVSR